VLKYTKKYNSKMRSQDGFTLMELMVALVVLALFYGLVITNFSVWRGPQYVKVSANELATNINKLHSYSLSARNLNGNPAKLYALQFVTTVTPGTYLVQGLEAASGGDVYRSNVETATFPGGVYVQDIKLKKGSTETHPTCMQLAFSLPFGRVYMNPACDFHLAKTNSALDALANSELTITLARNGTDTTKSIVVDGVSGRVTIE
jgi:prepilin-type N-terminal cleavage/methylation domain-containing protein